ncbi:hypothetical protein GCM10008986_20350 [Salinibacillus aidingensis]|uniref:YhdB-like protein n=1 Tax=Salinibacillus aidingensis TaxID=237684 RepID=A0ABN1BBI7_9BACI
MKIKELYYESFVEDYPSLTLLIDYLVNERKLLTLLDDVNSLQPYLQDHHKSKMNARLIAYKEYLECKKKA